MRNLNVGIMGHVDSGKTTMAKWLSEHASTACFDKSPQSQSRGITLDLGFSSMLLDDSGGNGGVRVTFVDCPGHAALFKNVIGAASVIDAVMLVVDGTKGVQTQTAECLVLASIVTKHLIVAVNKSDAVPDVEAVLMKIKRQLQSTTSVFDTCQYITVSAKTNVNKQAVIDSLQNISANTQPRDPSKPFLMAIDHGFAIKGQGHILTGTILQGSLSVSDTIIIPDLPAPVRVKSMQSFRQPVRQAIAGDRVGCCVDACPVKIERSVAVRTADMKSLTCAFLMSLHKIPFFKESIRSKQRLHISILHETVLCKQIIFCRRNSDEYEWIDELIESTDNLFAVVLLEEAILVPNEFLVIGSKMDINVESKSCRLCLYGTVIDNNINIKTFPLFKYKERTGVIDRVVDGTRAIGRGLVDNKGGVVSKFLGWRVSFVNDNVDAVIQSAFGTTGKFNLSTRSPRNANEPFVMRFKKYALQPGKPIKQ